MSAASTASVLLSGRASDPEACVEGAVQPCSLAIAREKGWTAPSTEASGSLAPPASKTEAVEAADTARAESETKAEEGK